MIPRHTTHHDRAIIIRKDNILAAKHHVPSGPRIILIQSPEMPLANLQSNITQGLLIIAFRPQSRARRTPKQIIITSYRRQRNHFPSVTTLLQKPTRQVKRMPASHQKNNAGPGHKPRPNAGRIMIIDIFELFGRHPIIIFMGIINNQQVGAVTSNRPAHPHRHKAAITAGDLPVLNRLALGIQPNIRKQINITLIVTNMRPHAARKRLRKPS